MDEITTEARWNDSRHKAAPGREHAELEILEMSTGHAWERTDSREIKLYPLERRCQGPVCGACGFTFCVECGVPENLYACSHDVVKHDSALLSANARYPEGMPPAGPSAKSQIS